MAEDSGCTAAEKQMMNDLLNYVKTYYLETTAEEEINPDTVAKLDARIKGDYLTVNSSEFKSALSGAKADTLNQPSLVTVSVDKSQGKITVKASDSFRGEVRIYVGGHVDKFSLKAGEEIALRIPAAYIFGSVSVKLFDGEGNLIPATDAADAELGVTGSLSLVDSASDNEALKAFYAYAYATKLAYVK